MSTKDLIVRELDHVPDAALREVLDFVLFLRNKNLGEKLSTAIASESALGKDWLTPEEDEAWADL